MTIMKFRPRLMGFGLCLLVSATGFAGDSSAGARDQHLLQIEEAKLTASDAAAGDEFGISVAIDGDIAVVGAQWDSECPEVPFCDSGAAYVYRFDGAGWNEEAKLTASDGGELDKFGFSVSISGDAIVVGSYLDDNPATSAGSAYVYRFDGVSWNEEAKLIASDAAEFDRFGVSVSVSGDTVAVGAYRNDDACFGDPTCDSGAAYVYRFDGVSWNEEAKLTASDAAADDEFGISVSISGDTLVSGAFGDDDAGSFSGAAYVYRFDGLSWNEEAKLTASDAARSDQFGLAVSIDGAALVVGAYGNDDVGADSGSAYVYRFDGAGWNEEAKLTASDAAEFDDFGWSVSISGDSVVVGALFDDDAGDLSGSAYVYRFDGVGWSEEAKLTASDAAAGDKFGVSVSVSGDTVVVGAYQDDDAGSASGSAYVYRLLPTPDIKANGSDGPITVPPSTPVSITVNLNAGSLTGQWADWWVVARTPFTPPSDWYSYIHPTGWVPGIDPASQAPLFNLSPPFEVLNRTLPLGDYIFYFAVDDNADGLPDGTWLDSVEVHVQ